MSSDKERIDKKRAVFQAYLQLTLRMKGQLSEANHVCEKQTKQMKRPGAAQQTKTFHLRKLWLFVTVNEKTTHCVTCLFQITTSPLSCPERGKGV